MEWRGAQKLEGAKSHGLKSLSADPEVMKTVLGILAAGSCYGGRLRRETGNRRRIQSRASSGRSQAEQNQNTRFSQPIASLSVETSNEFEANSVMAENKYMNQPVELIGFIGSIDDSLFDEKNVNITITAGEYSFSSVSCSKPRSAPEVSELRKGMRVAVRGVASEEMGVELSRCKFWSYAQDRWIEQIRGPSNKLERQATTTKQSSCLLPIAKTTPQQTIPTTTLSKERLAFIHPRPKRQQTSELN